MPLFRRSSKKEDSKNEREEDAENSHSKKKSRSNHDHDGSQGHVSDEEDGDVTDCPNLNRSGQVCVGGVVGYFSGLLLKRCPIPTLLVGGTLFGIYLYLREDSVSTIFSDVKDFVVENPIMAVSTGGGVGAAALTQ